jgi:hypothetical protein
MAADIVAVEEKRKHQRAVILSQRSLPKLSNGVSFD